MNKLFALLALLTTSVAQGQYTYDWAKRLAGNDLDWSYDIAVDAQGNVITTGQYSSTADFDPSTEGVANLVASDNNSRAFISKLDPDGNYLWAKGPDTRSVGRALAVDSDGNIYAAGAFQNSFDFDDSENEIILTSNGINDAYLLKYTPEGVLLWAKSFGGEGHDSVVRMAVNEDGEVVVCGYFVYTVDFDPGEGEEIFEVTGTTHANDIFISKFDTNGLFLWAHHMAGESTQNVEDISFDSQGNVVVTGRFSGSMNCDPLATNFTFESNGGNDWDVFVAKLNGNGEFQWAKRIGAEDNDVGYGIAVDTEDNIIYTGHFGNTVDLDPGQGVQEFTETGTYYDAFISKLDSDGNFIWAKQLTSDQNDYGASVAVDASGNIYTTGYTAGACDMDPGQGTVTPTWLGDSDIFISVLNADGGYLWGENFGAHSGDWGNDIEVDDNHIYVTGLYQQNFANFGDFTLMSAGGYDVFVFKLSHPATSKVVETDRMDFQLYPNPADNNIMVSTKEVGQHLTITDSSGRIVWQSSQVNNQNNSIDVSHLAEGVYMMTLIHGNTLTHQRFIVTH